MVAISLWCYLLPASIISDMVSISTLPKDTHLYFLSSECAEMSWNLSGKNGKTLFWQIKPWNGFTFFFCTLQWENKSMKLATCFYFTFLFCWPFCSHTPPLHYRPAKQVKKWNANPDICSPFGRLFAWLHANIWNMLFAFHVTPWASSTFHTFPEL